jgi:hypothetical protein
MSFVYSTLLEEHSHIPITSLVYSPMSPTQDAAGLSLPQTAGLAIRAVLPLNSI